MKFGLGKKKNTVRGKLIVIDGVDGSGKATQTNMLVETLLKEGFQVEMLDFPQYGRKSAGAVEEYLNGRYGQVNPYASSIFYAVDRFDASFKVREALDQGKIVISNRYVTSSAGHQGGKIADEAARIKYFKWLDNLEYNIFGIPKPDFNVILHVPAKVAQKLVGKKSADKRIYIEGKIKKDLHEKDLYHLHNAEQVFIQIAKMFPNTRMVECVEQGRLLTPLEVHNKVWNLVRRLVLKNVQPAVLSKK